MHLDIYLCTWWGTCSSADEAMVLRVDSPVMRQLKIDWFEINTLKLQAVSHNTTRFIIPASTLYSCSVYEKTMMCG